MKKQRNTPIQEQAGEKEIKTMLDSELLAEDGREESSKITEFYFGADEEWQ